MMVLISLHLSSLLLFSVQDLLPLLLSIVVPFGVVALGFAMWRPKTLRRRYRIELPSTVQVAVIEGRLKLFWRFWVVAAVIETIASGGFPIIWLFTNPSKTYFDYGIPSVHGFVNSILLAVGLCYFALYLLTGERRHLKVPLFSLFWWLVLGTRGTFLSALVEFAVLYLRMRRIRVKTLNMLAASSILVVLFFGWIGDIRSGAEYFRNLAQPTASYPEWLPSGFLWVYIYATTPVNNMAYTMSLKKPDANPLFPHTLAQLLPTVVRDAIYGDRSAAVEELSGELVESSFNVSSAYIGPARDFGLPAVFMFSLAAAIVCQWFWYKSDLRSQLMFAVLAMCLLFSVFYDLFLSLPLVAEMAWFFFILGKKRTRKEGIKFRQRLAVRG